MDTLTILASIAVTLTAIKLVFEVIKLSFEVGEKLHLHGKSAYQYLKKLAPRYRALTKTLKVPVLTEEKELAFIGHPTPGQGMVWGEGVWGESIY